MKQQLLNKFVIKMQGKIESEKIVSLFTTELNNDMDHSSNTPFITGFEPRLREFLNDIVFYPKSSFLYRSGNKTIWEKLDSS